MNVKRLGVVQIDEKNIFGNDGLDLIKGLILEGTPDEFQIFTSEG